MGEINDNLVMGGRGGVGNTYGLRADRVSRRAVHNSESSPFRSLTVHIKST